MKYFPSLVYNVMWVVALPVLSLNNDTLACVKSLYAKPSLLINLTTTFPSGVTSLDNDSIYFPTNGGVVADLGFSPSPSTFGCSTFGCSAFGCSTFGCSALSVLYIDSPAGFRSNSKLLKSPFVKSKSWSCLK